MTNKPNNVMPELHEKAIAMAKEYGIRCSAGVDIASDGEFYFCAWIGSYCATGETLDIAFDAARKRYQEPITELTARAESIGYKLVKAAE